MTLTTLHPLQSTGQLHTCLGFQDVFLCICIKGVFHGINRRLSRVLYFLHGEELVQVMESYEERWGMPMCAGALDGMHIPILAPQIATRIKFTVKVITALSCMLV